MLCSGLLLSAGYGWGYASAYTQYYSLSSLMDRETLDLDFNSRLLHYADANQPEKVRSRLYQRLSEQVRYVDRIIASSVNREMARNAAASLQKARLALNTPRTLGNVAVNAGAPVANPTPAAAVR